MNKLLQTRFPAVRKGVEAIPPALAFVGPVIPKIEAIGSDFRSVDDIPGLGLPLASVSWLVLLLGSAVVVVGIGAVARPGGLTAAAVATIGLLMVVVPVALNLPGKFAAGQRTVVVGRIALSQHAANAAEATTLVIDNLVREVKGSMIPALSSRLGESPAAFSKERPAAIPRSHSASPTGMRSARAVMPWRPRSRIRFNRSATSMGCRSGRCRGW
jgi:hypothetical protein